MIVNVQDESFIRRHTGIVKMCGQNPTLKSDEEVAKVKTLSDAVAITHIESKNALDDTSVK